MVTEPLKEGIAHGHAGRTLADFDVAPFVRITWNPPCRPAATR